MSSTSFSLILDTLCTIPSANVRCCRQQTFQSITFVALTEQLFNGVSWTSACKRRFILTATTQLEACYTTISCRYAIVCFRSPCTHSLTSGLFSEIYTYSRGAIVYTLQHISPARPAAKLHEPTCAAGASQCEPERMGR
eukprot:scpid72684/ scgid15472/ 